ncbi:hypothetical protein SAMN04487969_104235 [Paenibacillus algorifonticola]|uniref:DUF6630 domain-containing protein n=1 Tax=Paenibacillus algorifonticola TaxID=684063 RepID=A0A1I2C301_9BACL|nr:DUF6630 family protein [Paenibacillus algorifonticola]SFE62615.1 hypothetical protein SAMN04487969_104235 [Paenibacillus algorifonticola]
MGWFGFGFMRKKGSKQHRLQQAPTAEKDDPQLRNTALLELSRRLAFGQSQIVDEVSEAILHEEDYFVRWFDRLDERGISCPIPELPWFALVDSLQAEGLACEIDWKEGSYEVASVIENLLARKQLLPEAEWNLEHEADEILPTYDFLVKMFKLLQVHSITLACMDINSDSYVLITVRMEEYSELRALAARAGYRIDGFEQG